MKHSKITLENYLNTLQVKGRYTFTRMEALTVLGCSNDALRFAALRLIKKKRLIRPTRNFYVIVPTEYLEVGAPPITWFIDSLMKFYEQPYYVGLLSAAALYGAAHQQPQVFQIITNKALRPVKVGQFLIKFYTKKQISLSSYQPIKTPTGYMNVSIPEITAFDLVRYIKPAGYLNNIATVLSELQEKFDKNNFVQIFENMSLELPDIQRLGYLLEFVDADKEIVGLFKHRLNKQKLRLVPLRVDKNFNRTKSNMDWRLYFSEKIESDI